MPTRLGFFFSSRRRHTRYWRDWSSDVCSSDLLAAQDKLHVAALRRAAEETAAVEARLRTEKEREVAALQAARAQALAAQDKLHVAALRRAAEETAAVEARLRTEKEREVAALQAARAQALAAQD